MKISIPFYSATGEAKDALSLEIAERFSKLNASLISQAIYIEQNRSLIKAGKSMTKGEIRGGGRKPWKQKGTGRARAGSSRSPLWRGGGVTFGPTGINKVLELPKKMKELAFGQMLCAKIQSKELCVIESAKVKSKKTKEASDIAIKIANGKKIQLYVTKEERMDCLPWRNLGFVESNVFELIPFKILTSNQQIVVSNEVFNLIKEKLAK